MIKQTLKYLLLLSISALIAGCKLAVIVVEGGEVISDSSGICTAGSICIVEVPHTNFNDAFEPVPDEGWYFDSWNRGDGFLCGGSNYPVCVLSFEGYEDTEAVNTMVASSEVVYLMPLFKPIQPDIVTVEGRTITVEGREWLQPVDFVGYSYHQLSEVCPDGVCSGSLPDSTVNLTGYLWASSDDVGLLLQAYRKADRAILGDFEFTRILAFPSGDALGIEVILSDPPRVQGPEMYIFIATVIGDGIDPESEVQGMIEFGGDLDVADPLGSGAWFWKPIE